MLGVHKVKHEGGNKIYRQHRYFVTITNTRFLDQQKYLYWLKDIIII